jgi:hypothetical protein
MMMGRQDVDIVHSIRTVMDRLQTMSLPAAKVRVQKAAPAPTEATTRSGLPEVSH